MSSSITSPLTRPDINASEQSRKELQDKLTGLGGLGGRQLSAEAKAKKLREACEGFESIFIQKMWQEMRNTVPKGGLLHGREEKFWQDMYDQELSKSMTKAGGIGLADMMYEQLSRNLGDASRVAAGTAQGAAFMPAAAPLLPEVVASIEMAPEATENKVAESIYDGEAPEVAMAPDTQPAQAMNESASKGAPLAVAPAMQPAEATPKQAHLKEKPHRKTSKAVDMSGPDLAYVARRDAGDKLGSRAVRPAIRQRTEKQLAAEEARFEAMTQQPQPVQPLQAEAPKPGSPEALAAALEAAKQGAGIGAPTANPSLNQMVAQVQSQNAARAVPENAPRQEENIQQEAAPQIRKVTYTTNTPRSKKSDKQAKQAIRMLNVDNVGVNSRAGQGLAAYHAAQEARKEAERAAQPVAPLTVNQAQNMAQATPATANGQTMPAQPLKASDSTEAPMAAMPTIPPLTAADLRG